MTTESEQIGQRAPFLGDARLHRRHRNLGRAAGDQGGENHAERCSFVVRSPTGQQETNEAGYDEAEQGDQWKIEGVRQAVTTGETSLFASTGSGGEVPLEARLLPREREVLLAAGTLKLDGSTRHPIEPFSPDRLAARE
jgi:hypothetical protein